MAFKKFHIYSKMQAISFIIADLVTMGMLGLFCYFVTSFGVPTPFLSVFFVVYGLIAISALVQIVFAIRFLIKNGNREKYGKDHPDSLYGNREESRHDVKDRMAQKKTCMYCGTLNDVDANYCDRCGRKL